MILGKGPEVLGSEGSLWYLEWIIMSVDLEEAVHNVCTWPYLQGG